MSVTLYLTATAEVKTPSAEKAMQAVSDLNALQGSTTRWRLITNASPVHQGVPTVLIEGRRSGSLPLAIQEAETEILAKHRLVMVDNFVSWDNGTSTVEVQLLEVERYLSTIPGNGIRKSPSA